MERPPIGDQVRKITPSRPARSADFDIDLALPSATNEIATRIVSATPQQARIRKRPSMNNMTSGQHPESSRPFSSSVGSSMSAPIRSSQTASTARKGSLRNVVRRIFGRKSKEEEGEVPQAPPSRHGYHKSDPGALTSIREHQTQAPHVLSLPNSPKRAVSHPILQLEELNSRRVRSPYAVEFPQSARLKPLELENPFHRAHPRSPRRRASLPSFMLDDVQAASVAKAMDLHGSQEVFPIPEVPRLFESEIGLAVTSGNNSKRRSRSADEINIDNVDLRPLGNRDEEIKYWRESYNGSVLRNSFLSNKVSPIESSGNNQSASTPTDERTDDPFVLSNEVFDTGAEGISPAHDSPVFSRPDTGYEHDNAKLSDRIYNNEQDVLGFHTSIKRLTAQNNRQTILIDTTSQRKSRGNSVMTHQDQRDTNSPHRSTDSPPARTFTALYNIISSERSARRALESQVRTLALDLAEVKYQLSQPIITQASPVYMAPPQQEQHRTRVLSQLRNSNQGSELNIQDHRLTSRFSRTESMASTSSGAARLREAERKDGCSNFSYHRYQRDADDGRTPSPYEVYQTPITDGAEWSKTRSISGDGMF